MATFAEQLVIGAAVGVAGGFAPLWFVRRVPLPGAGLRPVRALAAFSVPVQGGTVGWAARRFGVPMRTAAPAPWTFGVRLPHEPRHTRRDRVAPGDAADGATLGDLVLSSEGWVSTVLRGGHLIAMSSGTEVRAGDELLLVAGETGQDDDGAV